MITASIVTYSDKPANKSLSPNDIILKNCVLFLCKNKLISNVLIVDNSHSQVFNWLEDFDEKIKYHHTKGNNLGYGKAHNLSCSILKLSKYHIIVNPDIIFVDDECIEKLFLCMESNSEIGLIQPLISSYPDGSIQKLCKKNPTLLIQLIRGFANTFIRKIRFLKEYNSWYEMDKIAYGKEIVDTEYLSGCFMFCRVKILNKIGWFDKRYFMYLEDADLTRSLSKYSRCVHIPSIEVRHVWGKGSHKNIFLKIIAIQSFILYSLKWGLKIF